MKYIMHLKTSLKRLSIGLL